ncbi:MAG: thioredoxin-dependent thiol peroxidase [Bacteroidetes bacterium]|uniref:thioredoxin-dependent peroxiredoxin n=1 Tax=Candidatus Merdivivens pullistercoris TaxID=2840873 RepID=A0A9D9I253_9BACT|nr:thioredoxin-dependent thiol peroxidase [Candidatus Merdivivens pullistercoris]
MLKIGDKAPAFSGIDQDGNAIKSEDFAGRKLVLYFYPKDSTPGCTAEACDLRDNYQRFLAAGYAVVGVSKDSAASHKRFIEKYSLPFPLISDTSTEILRAYEAWGEKKNYGKVSVGTLRKTYVIDENGIITDIVTKVNTKAHASQILG